MDDERHNGPRYLDVRPGQPLIAIPFQDGDVWVTRYFASEADANAFTARESRIQRSLGAIGGWDDIDFDEMLDELDRIRHTARRPRCPIHCHEGVSNRYALMAGLTFWDQLCREHGLTIARHTFQSWDLIAKRPM